MGADGVATAMGAGDQGKGREGEGSPEADRAGTTTQGGRGAHRTSCSQNSADVQVSCKGSSRKARSGQEEEGRQEEEEEIKCGCPISHFSGYELPHGISL